MKYSNKNMIKQQYRSNKDDIQKEEDEKDERAVVSPSQ